MCLRDVYEECIFYIVVLGYVEYIMKIESRICRFVNGNIVDVLLRQVFFDDILDLFSSR